MSDVHDHPSHRLHALVGRLDEVADQFLRESYAITYPRYLLLATIDRLDGPTQRELAAAQRVSEPATSRMVASLVASGHLESVATAGRGNRRAVALTATGEELLLGASQMLGDAFDALAAHAGVSPAAVGQTCDRLLASLDAMESA